MGSLDIEVNQLIVPYFFKFVKYLAKEKGPGYPAKAYRYMVFKGCKKDPINF